MKFYDLNEIKTRADCQRVAAELLGLKLNCDNRCAANWRGGTNENSVHVDVDAWFDHGAKQGGDVITLVKTVRGISFETAVELLGEYLGLQATNAAMSTKPVRKRVCEYEYCLDDGTPAHRTVRWEPKTFTQERFEDGEWKPGLDKMPTVLYRLSEVLGATRIYVVEGEKDADNLSAILPPDHAATTAPMGAEKWCDDYTAVLAGREVVIIPDNDEAGERHVKILIAALFGKVASLRIVRVPTGKDVSDWLAAGGTAAMLEQLVARTEPYNPMSPRQIAKEANKTPLRNYAYIEDIDNDSKKTARVALPITALLAEMDTRFCGFPRRIGESLFDHDFDTREIRFLHDTSALRAWIAEKSRRNPDFDGRVRGGTVTWEMLFESLRANSRRYEMITGTPTWPTREDAYYTYEGMPDPTPGAAYFNRLMEMLLPDRHSDAVFMRAMFATPLWYVPEIKRPLFIVDSRFGRGTGKSTLVEVLAYLYGDPGKPASRSPISVAAATIANAQAWNRVHRSLLTEAARTKRVFMLDNVTGFFHSDELARMVTENAITDLAPYGHDMESRPNDLTYTITSNGCTLDTDLSNRAVFVHVKRPEMSRSAFEDRVYSFIREHQLQILADIIGILDAGIDFEIPVASRFATWERRILAPMCGSLEVFESVWKQNEEFKVAADQEREQADVVREHFQREIQALGYDPDTDPVWIQTSVIKQWCRDAIPGFGGPTGGAITHIVKNFFRSGLLELSDEIQKYPHDKAQRTRGMMWNIDSYRAGRRPYIVRMGTESRIEREI